MDWEDNVKMKNPTILFWTAVLFLIFAVIIKSSLTTKAFLIGISFGFSLSSILINLRKEENGKKEIL